MKKIQMLMVYLSLGGPTMGRPKTCHPSESDAEIDDIIQLEHKLEYIEPTPPSAI